MTPQQYSPRVAQIDYAARAALAWGMTGEQTRRLMRLCARWRTQCDEGHALTTLKTAILKAAPQGVSVGFSASEVYVGGSAVP